MHHSIKLNLLMALLLVSVSMAGCAQGADRQHPTEVAAEVATRTPETAAIEAAAELEGTRWKLDSYVNGQGEAADVLPYAEITIEFKDGQVGGSAGCNTYFATYEVEGNSLTIGPVVSTMMACEPAVNEQETQYLAALGSAASYQVTDNKLQIANVDGETVLTLETEPEAGIANPASVYCEEQGGRLEIRTGEGGQVGYCVFPNGSECEEWAFFRGEYAPESAP